MKKLVLALVLLLVAVSLFAQGSAEAQTASKALDPYKQPSGKFVCTPQMIGYEDAEIELTWQPNPSQSMSSSIPSRVEVITKHVKEWVEKHPNVKVIPVGTTSNINDNMAKLQISVVEGGAPDLVAVDSFVMPQFLEYAQDITDAVKKAGVDPEGFFPYVKDQAIVNGQLKALWYTTDVRALFYRKDLLSKDPVTVDDVIEAGKAMKGKVDMPLIYVGGRGEGSVNNLWGLYWCQGAKLTNPDGTMAIDKDPGKSALTNLYKFVKRTIDEGITPTTIINYPRDAAMAGDIAAGKVGMFMSNTSSINNIRLIIGKEKFDETWAMCPLPVMEAGQKSTCSAGGWTMMVFAKDPLKKELAADLGCALFITDDAAYEYLGSEGSLPTQAHQFEKFDYITSDPLFVKQIEYLDSASTRPGKDAIYSVISTEAQVGLGNVITGSATPEQAVETVIKNVKNN